MKTYDIRFPARWSEVTAADLRKIASVMSAGTDAATAKVLLFCALSGLRPLSTVDSPDPAGGVQFFLDRRRNVVGLDLDIVRQACTQLAFVLDTVGLPAESPIADVSVKLYGVTFGDYFSADAHYCRYVADEAHPRQEFARAWHCLTARRLGSDWKVRALEFGIWWAGVGQWFRERYPYVFANEPAGDAVSPAETLQEVLTFLTGSRPQDDASVMNAEVNSVLSSLNVRYKMMKEYDDKTIPR